MANNLVFNEVASKLKVLVNGMDGSTTRPMNVDSNGNVVVTATDLDIRNLNATDDIVTVQSITETVRVDALDLDIRNLNATDDIVTVQSVTETVRVDALDLDIRDLSAATDSISVVNIVQTVTDSSSIIGVTNATDIFMHEVDDVSEYSYYVKNTGSEAVTVALQVAPIDNDNYYIDDTQKNIAVGDIEYLVPSIYGQYSRLYYTTNGNSSDFEVYYVARK